MHFIKQVKSMGKTESHLLANTVIRRTAEDKTTNQHRRPNKQTKQQEENMN